jgi:HEAT repeat protein
VFIDPDLHVRRAALRAAIASPAPGELAALLDVARRDPDLQARAYAIRALAKLKAESAASGLRELWDGADETLRQGIVEAWVELVDVGGVKHLAWLLSGPQSLPRVLAAARALRFPAFQRQAEGVLKQALGPGNVEQRVLSLQLAPLTGELLPWVVAAAKEGPTRVRLAANAALVALPAQREMAHKRLRVLAEEKDVHVVAAARSRLVALGDVSVAGSLLPELKSLQPSARATAARQLIDLGRSEAVLETLLDDVASVRMQTACALLVNKPLRQIHLAGHI